MIILLDFGVLLLIILMFVTIFWKIHIILCNIKELKWEYKINNIDINKSLWLITNKLNI